MTDMQKTPFVRELASSGEFSCKFLFCFSDDKSSRRRRERSFLLSTTISLDSIELPCLSFFSFFLSHIHPFLTRVILYHI